MFSIHQVGKTAKVVVQYEKEKKRKKKKKKETKDTNLVVEYYNCSFGILLNMGLIKLFIVFGK